MSLPVAAAVTSLTLFTCCCVSLTSGVGGSHSNQDSSTRQPASLTAVEYASVNKTTAGASNVGESSIATVSSAAEQRDSSFTADGSAAGGDASFARNTPSAGAMVVMDDSGHDEAGYSTIQVRQCCHHCRRDVIAEAEELVNYQGNLWHPRCFVYVSNALN